jgi:hypothetical protein
MRTGIAACIGMSTEVIAQLNVYTGSNHIFVMDFLSVICVILAAASVHSVDARCWYTTQKTCSDDEYSFKMQFK